MNDHNFEPGERRECVLVSCESCGGAFWEQSMEFARCLGCGLILCQSCVDAWSHIEKQEHGRGSPSDGMRRMERVAREAVRLCAETAKEVSRRFESSAARVEWDSPQEGRRLDSVSRGALAVWAEIDPIRRDEIIKKALAAGTEK